MSLAPRCAQPHFIHEGCFAVPSIELLSEIGVRETSVDCKNNACAILMVNFTNKSYYQWTPEFFVELSLNVTVFCQTRKTVGYQQVRDPDEQCERLEEQHAAVLTKPHVARRAYTCTFARTPHGIAHSVCVSACVRRGAVCGGRFCAQGDTACGAGEAGGPSPPNHQGQSRQGPPSSPVPCTDTNASSSGNSENDSARQRPQATSASKLYRHLPR